MPITLAFVVASLPIVSLLGTLTWFARASHPGAEVG
jgi:hypothetical protein